MPTPIWLLRLKLTNQKASYNHEVSLDFLSYDEQMALALIHMHELTSRDIDFIKMGRGNVDAAKKIYKEHHYKKTPTQKTLNRLNVDIQPGRDKNGAKIAGTDPGFFRIHTAQAPTLLQTAQKIPIIASPALIAQILLQQIKESKCADLINKIKNWFRFWD